MNKISFLKTLILISGLTLTSNKIFPDIKTNIILRSKSGIVRNFKILNVKNETSRRRIFIYFSTIVKYLSEDLSQELSESLPEYLPQYLLAPSSSQLSKKSIILTTNLPNLIKFECSDKAFKEFYREIEEYFDNRNQEGYLIIGYNELRK